ncbi:MAG: sigma-54 dependent transcriptional regulator [Burkholderiales bacterium]
MATDDGLTTLARAGMLGRSEAFRRLVADIRRLAVADVPVLLQGETGTGKELVARAIHYLGARRDGPFVPVDAGALPDTLFERELFGHLRGAFTDARRDAQGLIAQAERGTLFFDELHTLDKRSQAALLRFMQDHTYRPLGAQRLQHADVRIVAATNRRLDEGVAQGWFREDLYYRVNVATIDLPSLRERAEDIPMLAANFLERLCAHYRCGDRRFDAAFLAWMAQQRWPGNVRELENFVHREFLRSESRVLALDPGRASDAGARDDATCRPFKLARALALTQFETGYLRALLAATRGNVSEAARRAGKERRVFGRLLKKHNIARTDFTRTMSGDSR